MKTSIASVTFRSKSIEEIANLAKKAGLHAIEWGGDVHVPPMDKFAAKKALLATTQNRLSISAYGSYFKALENELFEPILHTAQLLECRIIRIWAGTTASNKISPIERNYLVDRLKKASELAAKAGLVLATEYHADTLTDTAASTFSLLESVPNLKTFWQPPIGRAILENLNEIKLLSSRLENVHVYHRDMQGACRPLSEGYDNWTQYFSALPFSTERFATLEFVKDTSEQQFLSDADVLHSLLKEIKNDYPIL